MWMELKKRLAADLARVIEERFGVESRAGAGGARPAASWGISPPPPAMQLARVLKRNPRAIAEELAAALGRPDRLDETMVRDIQIQGAGFINFFLDRRAFAAALMDASLLDGGVRGAKVVIEHTNINPNKAAHIGHLRNAVLGDVLGRSLKSLGYPVEIQNYIDDTGVQVADVVVGFLDLRGLSLADVAAIPEPFDYYCWDLYSEVGRWFAEHPERQGAPPRDAPRDGDRHAATRAEMGRLVARRVVSPPSRHDAAARRRLRPADPRERHPGAATSSSRPSAG